MTTSDRSTALAASAAPTQPSPSPAASASATGSAAAPSIIGGIAERADWTALARRPDAGLFVSPPWLGAIEDTYGLTAEAVVIAGPAGDLLAGVPICRLDDAAGPRVRSFPFSDHCDPVGAPWVELVPALSAQPAAVVARVLRDRSLERAPGFRRTGEAAWHGRDLAADDGAVLGARGSSGPRNAARAERLGVTVRLGRRPADLRAFYEMHRHVRRAKYRMLPQPWRFFEHLAARFGADGMRLLLAELDGMVVAGVLFLCWGDTIYYKFNASVETSARPNDLLVTRAVELAREWGYARMDFGLSDLDQPGLLRFKRKFATEEATISTFRRDGEGDEPSYARAFKADLVRLTGALTADDVPEGLVEAAGDVLYRYFA
jgi:CelD/BcsL family acetyltransferase involved in cellulose biosynthesis